MSLDLDRRSLLCAAGGLVAAGLTSRSLAAVPADLEPRTERIDDRWVRVRWRAIEPVDIFIADRPDATPSSARKLAGGDRSGVSIVSAPRRRRAYVLLRGRDSGRVVKTAERLLPLSGASNYRDLGGYRTSDGRYVRWGRIYRSGATPLLTDQDLADVGRLGVRTCIDLRCVEERELAPSRLPSGARYLTRDYSFKDLLDAGRGPDGRVTNPALYGSWPSLLAPQFRALFAALGEEPGAVAVNCTAGQDRTGLAAGLLLAALGVPHATILEDYHLSTAWRRPQNEIPEFDPAKYPHNRAAAGSAASRLETPRPLYGPDGRPYLQAAFEEIDARWGGVDAYLDMALGLGAPRRALLRDRLLESDGARSAAG